MRWLPVHPVPMRTTFSTCILVNFAVDPSALRRKLPPHLEPDVHDGKGYLSIVIARMERMRPAFLPEFLGVTYHQVVYRAVVRCGSERGVTFLRSDADSRFMVAAGNALTFFRFHLANVAWQERTAGVRVVLRPRDGSAAEIDASYEVVDPEPALPPTSRFPDVRSAQAFLSELYVAFGGRRADGRVEVVRIARTPWDSRIVPDRGGIYRAMTSGALFDASETCLDSIFLVRNLSYRWERLALERRGEAHASVGRSS